MILRFNGYNHNLSLIFENRLRSELESPKDRGEPGGLGDLDHSFFPLFFLITAQQLNEALNYWVSGNVNKLVFPGWILFSLLN